MKLKDLLKELQGYDIKVGAKTQFLYCGECNERTPKIIERLSENLLRYLKENQTNKNTKKPLIKVIQMINDFVPFLEREVVEVYDSLLHENEKIIRVAGMEQCKYWDKEEYQKARKKKNTKQEVIENKEEHIYKLGRRNIFLFANLDEVLTQYISDLINVDEACKMLRITRSMFFRVLKQEGIRKNAKKKHNE